MPVPREGDLATIGGLAVAAARAIFTATRLNSARDLLIFFYAGRYKHVVIRSGFTVSIGKTEILVIFPIFATHWEANFGPESG